MSHNASTQNNRPKLWVQADPGQYVPDAPGFHLIIIAPPNSPTPERKINKRPYPFINAHAPPAKRIKIASIDANTNTNGKDPRRLDTPRGDLERTNDQKEEDMLLALRSEEEGTEEPLTLEEEMALLMSE